PAGAGRGEDERLPRCRLEDFPESAEQAGSQLGERRGAVVLHRAVHGAEDSLGYVRGAGDEQEIAAGHRKRPQREGKNTASGLRYSATSVPQPLGWVGASPPKLRGANSLAPFQLVSPNFGEPLESALAQIPTATTTLQVTFAPIGVVGI